MSVEFLIILASVLLRALEVAGQFSVAKSVQISPSRTASLAPTPAGFSIAPSGKPSITPTPLLSLTSSFTGSATPSMSPLPSFSEILQSISNTLSATGSPTPSASASEEMSDSTGFSHLFLAGLVVGILLCGAILCCLTLCLKSCMKGPQLNICSNNMFQPLEQSKKKKMNRESDDEYHNAITLEPVSPMGYGYSSGDSY